MLTLVQTFAVARVPGIGVFITLAPGTKLNFMLLPTFAGVTSPAFERVMSRIHGISQVLIFLHIVQENRATVPTAESFQVPRKLLFALLTLACTQMQRYGSGIYAASIHKGFADNKVLKLLHFDC